MTRVFIGLGSNLGDRERFIRQAVEEIARMPETRLVRVSSLYDSEPVGVQDQPVFLNAVGIFETELEPRELLWHLQLVERRLGRVRAKRWGPRTVDLDILLYGDLVIEQEDLVVPHPELENRAFVLIPLFELDPELVHPGTGQKIREHLKATRARGSVRYKGKFWF
jgi:2-amino-4-hydroxy-6-hydroxymethyldihydropteridine diphosphokinase